MVNYCRVFGCTNRADGEKHLEYYRLPKVITNQGQKCKKLSEERRRLWLAKLNQDLRGKNLDNIRICSAHFVSGKKSDLCQKDDPDWVPSVGLTGQKGGSPQSTKETGNLRYKRRTNRTQQRLKAEAAAAAAAAAETDDPTTSDYVSDNLCCTGTPTELTGDVIEAMTTELQSLSTENIELSSDVAHLSTSYDQNAFVDKDEKVLFFTGLPTYQLLLVLFTYLSPHLPVREALDKFQQLMLTLMRLRLDVSTTFLSRAFNVPVATASKIVTDVIDVMFIRMKPLIIWPEREQLQKTMPLQFREHFGKTFAVIIDCFEVFIERPSNLIARAETWSSSKHHNTVKFLIGMTPQGTVSYISNAWGGRESDKDITENCGFLDNIVPGDLVLADRGFNIQAICSMDHLQIPAFTCEKSQLAPVDLETTRKTAHVRTHVERLIGCVRQKYTILGGVLPIDFLICKDSDGYCTIDKIGLVCCALLNLCPSVIDFD